MDDTQLVSAFIGFAIGMALMYGVIRFAVADALKATLDPAMLRRSSLPTGPYSKCPVCKKYSPGETCGKCGAAK